MKHDFASPKIRQMVEDAHVPVETWAPNDQLVVELTRISCKTCRYDWPCPTEVDYERWLHAEYVEAERARMERMAMKVEEGLDA
jgi:hypothetical protein